MENFGNKNYQVNVYEKSLLITVSFWDKNDFDDVSVSCVDIVELEMVYSDLKNFFDKNDRLFFFYDNYEFLHSSGDLKNEKIEKIKSLSTEKMIDYIMSGETYLNIIDDNNYINAEECGFGKIMTSPKMIYGGKVIEQNSYILNFLPYSTFNYISVSENPIKLFDFYKDTIKEYFIDELGINMFYKLTITKITLTSNLSFYRVRYDGSKIIDKNEKN